MMRRSATRRSLAVLALGAVLLTGTACSSDDEETSTDTTPKATVPELTTTTYPPSTTDGSGSTETTMAETTTTGGDVTEPVTLRLDGVGPATVGQGPDEAIAALSAALGEPSETQDWVQPSCELAGPDSDGARSVMWGGLMVTFRGASEADATLAGWTYTGGPAGTASELRLDTGVGVGDPGDDLSTAYGAAATYVPDEMFGPHWEVAQGGATLWAPVDGDAAGAPIARMDLNPGICE